MFFIMVLESLTDFAMTAPNVDLKVSRFEVLKMSPDTIIDRFAVSAEISRTDLRMRL